MSIKTKFFPVATIDTWDGKLVINSTKSSLIDRHYNVHVEINTDENTIKVLAEKPKYYTNTSLAGYLGKDEVDKIIDEDTEMYIPLFGKPYKRVKRNQWVEYKKRKKKEFNSNVWLIIESQKS
jgi:hypothetical protein